MNSTINWETVMYVAVCVLGTVQYLKGAIKNAPSWVWTIVMPLLCFAFAAAWQLLPPFVSIGLMAFAATQLGYDTIIKRFTKKIEKPEGGV